MLLETKSKKIREKNTSKEPGYKFTEKRLFQLFLERFSMERMFFSKMEQNTTKLVAVIFYNVNQTFSHV